MAQVEPMDVDNLGSDYDDKENSLQSSNVFAGSPCTEKGYEEFDTSDLNMKLRYSVTPTSSPMSRSYTANCSYKGDYGLNTIVNESCNTVRNENCNLTRSLNSTITKNDNLPKLSKQPLQALPTGQFVDSENTFSRSSFNAHGNITVTIAGNDSDDNLSLPSTSSTIQTPEATTPTKEIPKGDGGSPIMRGLKSVLNMFRSSQSPIPPVENVVAHQNSSLTDKTNDDLDRPATAGLVSTPIMNSKIKDNNSSKRSSPLKESVVFNNDMERELQWKDETTIFFKDEKIPIHKLFFQTGPSNNENKLQEQINDVDELNATLEYMDVSNMDISYKSSTEDKTMTDIDHKIISNSDVNGVESDCEFVDCEATYPKDELYVLETVNDCNKILPVVILNTNLPHEMCVEDFIKTEDDLNNTTEVSEVSKISVTTEENCVPYLKDTSEVSSNVLETNILTCELSVKDHAYPTNDNNIDPNNESAISANKCNIVESLEVNNEISINYNVLPADNNENVSNNIESLNCIEVSKTNLDCEFSVKDNVRTENKFNNISNIVESVMLNSPSYPTVESVEVGMVDLAYKLPSDEISADDMNNVSNIEAIVCDTMPYTTVESIKVQGVDSDCSLHTEDSAYHADDYSVSNIIKSAMSCNTFYNTVETVKVSECELPVEESATHAEDINNVTNNIESLNCTKVSKSNLDCKFSVKDNIKTENKFNNISNIVESVTFDGTSYHTIESVEVGTIDLAYKLSCDANGISADDINNVSNIEAIVCDTTPCTTVESIKDHGVDSDCGLPIEDSAYHADDNSVSNIIKSVMFCNTPYNIEETVKTSELKLDCELPVEESTTATGDIDNESVIFHKTPCITEESVRTNMTCKFPIEDSAILVDSINNISNIIESVRSSNTTVESVTVSKVSDIDTNLPIKDISGYISVSGMPDKIPFNISESLEVYKTNLTCELPIQDNVNNVANIKSGMPDNASCILIESVDFKEIDLPIVDNIISESDINVVSNISVPHIPSNTCCNTEKLVEVDKTLTCELLIKDHVPPGNEIDIVSNIDLIKPDTVGFVEVSGHDLNSPLLMVENTSPISKICNISDITGISSNMSESVKVHMACELLNDNHVILTDDINFVPVVESNSIETGTKVPEANIVSQLTCIKNSNENSYNTTNRLNLTEISMPTNLSAKYNKGSEDVIQNIIDTGTCKEDFKNKLTLLKDISVSTNIKEDNENEIIPIAINDVFKIYKSKDDVSKEQLSEMLTVLDENIPSTTNTDVSVTATELNLPLNVSEVTQKLSHPISPKFNRKCYNINFEEIDNPFATKTVIRLSPPREIAKHTFNHKNKNVQKRGSNRRKSQLESKTSDVTNKVKITNSSMIKQSNRKGTIGHTEDSKKDHGINSELTQDDPPFVSNIKESLEENKLGLKSGFDHSCNSRSLLDPEQENKFLVDMNKNHKAGQYSNCDKSECKSVFNLPETEDINYNPFLTKSDISLSPPPTVELRESYDTQNNIETITISAMEMLDKRELANTTVCVKDNIVDEVSNISNTTSSSRNTDDQDVTLREVHTEDEDTIEGPFIEAEDLADIVQVSDFKVEKDMMQLEDFPATLNNEEIAQGELFINAEAFEMLLNQNKSNTVADSGKESLFLKFDPLFAKRVSSDGIFAALNSMQKKQSTPQKPKTSLKKIVHEETIKMCPLTTGSGSNNEEAESAVSKPMMVVNPAVNSVVTQRKSLTPPKINRRSLTFSSPAMVVIDRLLSLSGDSSLLNQDVAMPHSNRNREADIVLMQLREHLAEKEIHVHDLKCDSKQLKDRLILLESQVSTLANESEERLKKVNSLNECLIEKTKINKTMAVVVEEYERTIATLIAEIEQERKQNAKEKMQLINERDEQTAHLASMEGSFSDLHSKYEKSKQIILSMKANEDIYRKSFKEFDENLLKMQKNYEQLKQHATSKLNHANLELDKMNRAHQAEVVKLNAMIKRKGLQITSLEETLTQKIKANEELTAICDELINKVG